MSSRPVPSFPLRRKILDQGGSLLVSVYLALVGLAECFCWITYPSLSCVLGGGGGLEGSKSKNLLGSNFVSQHDDFPRGLKIQYHTYINTPLKGGDL